MIEGRITEERELTEALDVIRSIENRRTLGFHYDGPCDFTRREGRWYSPVGHSYMHGPPRLCYQNAIHGVLLYGLKYVEGYATNRLVGGMPIHHAWNADDDGNAIDLTWGAWSKTTRQLVELVGSAYLGIEFSVERADDSTWNGDATVIDDWQRDWPILRKPWPGEDYSIVWPHSERLEVIRLKRDGRDAEAEALYEKICAEVDA